MFLFIQPSVWIFYYFHSSLSLVPFFPLLLGYWYLSLETDSAPIPVAMPSYIKVLGYGRPVPRWSLLDSTWLRVIVWHRRLVPAEKERHALINTLVAGPVVVCLSFPLKNRLCNVKGKDLREGEPWDARSLNDQVIILRALTMQTQATAGLYAYSV